MYNFYNQSDESYFANFFLLKFYVNYADDTTLMAESEEELKSLLMKVKEERENVA